MKTLAAGGEPATFGLGNRTVGTNSELITQDQFKTEPI